MNAMNLAAQRSAQAPRKKHPAWVDRMRAQLRAQCRGWSLSEQAGKVKATYRYTDGARATTTLDLPWCVDSVPAALQQVLALNVLVGQGHDLPAAAAVVAPKATTTAAGGRIEWGALVDALRTQRIASGAVTERTWSQSYGPTLRVLVEVMADRLGPKTGTEALKAVLARTGLSLPPEKRPGSRVYQVAATHVCGLLRFGVEELGLDVRWAPPAAQARLNITGSSIGREKSPAVPIMDTDVPALLESIPDARWRLAIELLWIFGLRPVELNHLQPLAAEGVLQVAYRKKTSRGSTRPRDVEPLDPTGFDGRGIQLLLELGVTDLPPLGSTDADAGMALRQYLMRRPVWRSLVSTYAARGQKLSPYSFRHAYAFRSADRFELPPRFVAPLMGHSLQTHLAHYGAWADRTAVGAAVERARARVLARS